jgi:peptidoglycan/LPS O-acetylase OafA/YrhL
MTAPLPRPRVVTAAFWCWVVASLLLIAGGMMAASVNIPVIYRWIGILTAFAGVGMAYLAGRSRRGDTRFRRAAVTLSLTLVVLVAVVAVLGVVHVLTLVAVIPLIAGTVLMTRPTAASSADAEPQ